MVRWRIAMLVTAAIAINYLDRLTLPTVRSDIETQSHVIFSDQNFALLNTAFLAAYGAMYLVGGKLLDYFGTRRGFAVIMIFWSLACASHGLANGLAMLVVCRLLLGIGEGGGFPAATRAVAEWFPVKERATAMGMINGGTGIGGMVALPFALSVVAYVHWLGILPWRWVFFLTGGLGIVWLIWWLWDYYTPEQHPGVTAAERALIQSGVPAVQADGPKITIAALFQYRETWGLVTAKFLTDAAWYFILFWLPGYLRKVHQLNIGKTMSVAWIPHAATFVGCMLGGGLSSWLLHRKFSLNMSRKLALFLSAALMPLLILVPYATLPWVIVLFSVGYFGQQSWSTLVMVLPTDLFPKRAVGTVAGLVGLGGALGGIVLGQLSGYLLDNGFDYKPVMLIAGLLHVSAFVVILATVRSVRPLAIETKAASTADRRFDTLELGVKLQLPAIVLMLLGLVVVNLVKGPAGFNTMIVAGGISMMVFVGLLLAIQQKRGAGMATTIAAMTVAGLGLAGKVWVLSLPERWGPDQFFAACCVTISAVVDVIVLISALAFLAKRIDKVDSSIHTEAVV